MIRNSRSFVTVLVGSGLALCLCAPPSFAQGTPWLAEPGTGSVNISFVNQNATEFFRQTTKVKGPLEATGANLAQNTMWFGVNYAINDSVAIDVQSAWARSFVAGAVGPSGGQESYSGIFDSTLAVTWRIVDELISDAPSVAVRVGAIIPGSYDTGYINSLGDGGAGVETSLIIGKFGSAAGSLGGDRLPEPDQHRGQHTGGGRCCLGWGKSRHPGRRIPQPRPLHPGRRLCDRRG